MTAIGALEQARHVFLHGCGLPEAWADQPQWRILESGFDAGLNFLATWHAWRTDAQRPRLLHYASTASDPVAFADLLRAASTYPALQPLAEALAAQWQGLTPGFHRFSFEQGRVLLTLCVGDTAAMLRELSFRADSVFLGSEPAEVKALTRLARRGATLATPLREDELLHDLKSAGWQVAPRAGLAPSRSATAARLAPPWQVKVLDDESDLVPADCVVIGAGLAGAAAAASLARRGWRVQVIDAAATPATGASNLPAGLLAPHQSPDDNLLSRLSRSGVRITLAEAQRLAAGIEWERTGVLEWRGDDARALPALGEALQPWSREATPAQKRAAGLPEETTAWWHDNAAWIEPAALVRAWLREPGVRFAGGRQAARLLREGERWLVQDAGGQLLAQAALVVVAAALDSAPLLQGRIQLHPVRGQLTWGPHGDDARTLPPFPVNGHGHFLPRVPLVERGAWITGSTYGRGDADASLRREDTDANLQRVREVMPQAAQVMQGSIDRREIRSWSGVRCASSDRRPLVGEVEAGLWVSTAMGSRGLTFAALCGELIAARLHAEPWPLEARLAQALDVSRQFRARPG
ncbi:MAG TPA: FAD-dependent 5-carboxymethylaminomethyl-2-thiouridine(34) oxidoreductase MnmC [Ramlibacter sp.]|jgi:tRNA 5-methylaminomethyl-2-thiouridine biosynthesis bifunctional protein|nr:FAD-dependent 5-carboxymethylaminomethyl-2-thiouridine(34) oxidoreductase MnmC [Ramlibacter sp.]